MMSLGKDKYKALEVTQKKLNNNYLPPIEYKLIIDDSKFYEKQELEKWNIHLIDVCVPLYGAGSAVIKFGKFNDNSREFPIEISGVFKLGSTVDILLGYGNQSNCRKVFRGFIYMIGEEYDRLSTEGRISYVVTIMDARKLMMINGEKHKLINGNSYINIIKDICRLYPKTIERTIADLGSTTGTSMISLSQDTNDYDFIVNEIIRSGKVGIDFYVSCGNAYLKSRKGKTTPKIAFSINELKSSTLSYFKSEKIYCNKNLNVYGYDYNKDTPVSSKIPIKTDADFLSTMATSIQGTSNYTDLLVNSSDLALDIAKNIGDREKYKTSFSIGRGKMNPNVEIGEAIAVNGVDKISSGLHFVTKVRHEVLWKLDKSSSGTYYIDASTYFECEGL